MKLKFYELYDKYTLIWFGKLSTNLKIIVSIVAVALLWMATGILSFKDKKAETSTQLMKVKFINSNTQGHHITLSYLGFTEPIKVVHIRPETDGIVKEVKAKEGMFLKAGEPIIVLDEKFYRDNLRMSEAQLEQEKINFTSSKALFDKKLSSTSAFFNAKKQLESAEAAVSQARDALRKTIISAPFDGYIDNIKVYQGDVLSAFQENRIALYYDMSKFKIALRVPQKDVLLVSDAKEVIINRPQSKIKCSIDFLSRSADESTRAFRLEAVCDNADNEVLAFENLRADVLISKEGELHYLPKSALTLEMNGDIVVKTISPESRVKSIKIEIMDEDSNGFWVSGLPEQAKVITLGQQFVIEDENIDSTLLNS